MNTKLVLKNVTPLTDVVDVLKAEKLETADALDVAALLKRADEFISQIRSKIIAEANKSFEKRCTAGAVKLSVLDGKAAVTAYTPRGVWEYPKDIILLEANLNGQKKQAQSNGRATKIPGVVDPKTNSIFAITVLESFEGI